MMCGFSVRKERCVGIILCKPITKLGCGGGCFFFYLPKESSPCSVLNNVLFFSVTYLLAVVSKTWWVIIPIHRDCAFTCL